MVVISDHKMVKGLFSQSASSGRLNMSFIDFLLDGNQHGKQNRNKFHIIIISSKKLVSVRII